MNCIDAKEALTNILAVSKDGYVRIGKMRNGVRKKVLAHRHIWEQCFGPIPVGMFVLHKCDNPPCVNPEHLFLGTQKDNMMDMIAKGRGVDNSGSRHGMSKLTDQQVCEILLSSETGVSIAKRFGVGKSTVSRIRNDKGWRHLK
jgi:hypothetical protein